jgi:hypothetical protein
MFGSLVSRFRLVTLLLALGLGTVGGVVLDAALASQMEGPKQAAVSAVHPSPTCPDVHSCAMIPGCTTAVCWTVSALPAQSTVLQPRPAAVLPEPAEPSITGIVSSPDPHPPRVFLRS